MQKRLIIILFVMFAGSVYADHGPASTAAAGRSLSSARVTAGHLMVGFSQTFTRFERLSNSDVRDLTLEMKKPGSHLDAFTVASLSQLELTLGLSDEWALNVTSGWYAAPGLREGLRDHLGDYRLIEAGDIGGFTDPAVGLFYTPLYWLTGINFSVIMPFGRTTGASDHVNLDTITVGNRVSFNKLGSLSPHLVEGSEFGSEGVQYTVEPSMMPGQGAWGFSTGFLVTTSDRPVDFFSAFQMTYHFTGNNSQIGLLSEIQPGFSTRSDDSIHFNFSLPLRYREPTHSYARIIENTGGLIIFQRLEAVLVLDDLVSTGSNVAFWYELPVFRQLNGPQQFIDYRAGLNLNILLHFIEH